jgi:hypothetical protein
MPVSIPAKSQAGFSPRFRSPSEYNRRKIVRYRDFFNPSGDFN